ncbi:MAG: hypothetical protein EOL88_06695 [Bacteroidia bacterium]|nr:hypothetical protein [Bacteroidia bacterium]
MNTFSSTIESQAGDRPLNFDFQLSWKMIVGFGAAFGLLTLSPYCVAACFVLLSVYAMNGRRQAVEAMAFSVVVKYANPALVAFPPFFGLYAWGFLYIASFSLLFRSKLRSNSLILPLTLFYITVLCISFWSRYPAISMLKATSFYVVVVSVLSGSLSMNKEDFQRLSRTIFSLSIMVLLFSLPTYFLHNIGFLRNGRGFQGILNHPQAFGIFWSPLCAWFIVRIFFIKNVAHLKKWVTLLCLLVACMFLSKSRTSMVATGLALFISFPVFLGQRSHSIGISMKKGAVLFLLVIAIVLALLGTSDTFSNAVSGFMTKGQTKVSVGEAFEHSRGRGVESHLTNFMKSPWIGNGFGVDATVDFGSRVKYLMGIPISASSEKGIVYTAILEEIGVIGLVAFLIFLGAFFSKATRLDPPLMALLFACLTVNVGEAVLFSVNGNGLIYWVLIGLCLASESLHGKQVQTGKLSPM